MPPRRLLPVAGGRAPNHHAAHAGLLGAGGGEGAAFRDAYREVAEAIASGRFEKTETTGNTEFRPFQPDPVSSQWASRRRSEMEATQVRVFGDL